MMAAVGIFLLLVLLGTHAIAIAFTVWLGMGVLLTDALFRSLSGSGLFGLGRFVTAVLVMLALIFCVILFDIHAVPWIFATFFGWTF